MAGKFDRFKKDKSGQPAQPATGSDLEADLANVMGTGKKPPEKPAASGGPKPSGEKAASMSTPEQAVADKANLRKFIDEQDTAIKNAEQHGFPASVIAGMKNRRTELQTNLEKILAQFPDSGAPVAPQAKPDVSKLKAAADALRAAGLSDEAQAAEAKIKELESATAAKPVETPKQAEAAKPAETKLTPEQQVLTDQVNQAAWLKPGEKDNFTAAIKGAKDATQLQEIERSLNILRDL